MKKSFADHYMSKYEDVRGVLTKKRKSIFGKHVIFVVSDGKKSVSVKVGKALSSSYPLGCELTVGHIGHKLINIRPGITNAD